MKSEMAGQPALLHTKRIRECSVLLSAWVTK
jgi:hypothetical protein